MFFDLILAAAVVFSPMLLLVGLGVSLAGATLDETATGDPRELDLDDRWRP